jgi:DNA sulfur modification protein DndD
MKLTSFRLCNFRQFYGSTPEIVLATEDKRQITVIHGNNGAGKTTLLNAFTWVLYERFTAAFESPEQLVNKRAIAETQIGNLIECWVEVAFEHGDTRYRMRRDCRTVKTESGISEGKTELRLRVAGDDGRWKIADQHPEDVIGKILPASLHQYFFFDGERIEQIVRSNKKAEIAEATKTLLGLEIPSRSIAHLGTVRKLLEKELEAIGNPETQQLLRQKEKLEQAIDQTVAEQEEIEQELENYQSIKQEVSQRLRQLDAVKEIQKRRDDLEA